MSTFQFVKLVIQQHQKLNIYTSLFFFAFNHPSSHNPLTSFHRTPPPPPPNHKPPLPPRHRRNISPTPRRYRAPTIRPLKTPHRRSTFPLASLLPLPRCRRQRQPRRLFRHPRNGHRGPNIHRRERSVDGAHREGRDAQVVVRALEVGVCDGAATLGKDESAQLADAAGEGGGDGGSGSTGREEP